MSSIPPTEGSKRCMCWQGYKGPSQEELAQKLAQKTRALKTLLPSPEKVVKRVREVQLWPPTCGDCTYDDPCANCYWDGDDE